MPGNLKFLSRNFFGEHQEGDFSWGKQLLSSLGKLDKWLCHPWSPTSLERMASLPHAFFLSHWAVLADLLLSSPSWTTPSFFRHGHFFRRSQSLCWSKAHCVFRPGEGVICFLPLCADLIRWFLRNSLAEPTKDYGILYFHKSTSIQPVPVGNLTRYSFSST